MIPRRDRQGAFVGTRGNAPIRNNSDTYVAKVDYVLNDRHSVFVRGQLQQDNENGDPQFLARLLIFRISPTAKASRSAGTRAACHLSTTRYGLTRQKLITAGIGTYEAVTWRVLDNPVGLTRSSQRTSPTHHLTQDFNLLAGAQNFQFGGSYRHYNNDRLSYDNSYFGINSNSSWLTSSDQILSVNLSLSALTNFGRYQGTLQPSRVMQLSLRYDF